MGRLENPETVSRLVVFDTWTLNCDRYSVREGGRVRKNLGNVFLGIGAAPDRLRLYAMDHTHCFTCGRELSSKMNQIDHVKEPRVFGKFPEFQGILNPTEVQRATAALADVSRSEVERIVGGIPPEWNVAPAARTALVDLIVQRAEYVAATLERKLFLERRFEFDAPESTEPSS